jgi:hypothetical protein
MKALSKVLRWLGPDSGHPAISGLVSGLVIAPGGYLVLWMVVWVFHFMQWLPWPSELH